jgi:hypothetical protein
VTALALALALVAAGERASARPGASTGSGEPRAETTDAPALPTAHPLRVEARASRTEVKLGEPFDYVIEIRHPQGEAYALPAAPALAPFQAEGGACRAAPDRDGDRTLCTLRLALFTLGKHEVPTLALAVTTSAGPAVLDVAGPAVTAIGVIDPAAPAESLQLRDIAPAVPLLVRTWRNVALLAGALAAVAVAALAWRAWRRRARTAAEPPAPVPPDVRLERRLDALEAERLPLQGRSTEHVARLSELVREYLGALARVPALDLTTSELLAALRASGDPRLDLPALAAFLERADVVKFARAGATPDDCTGGTTYARGLLARTRSVFAPLDASGWSAPAGGGR